MVVVLEFERVGHLDLQVQEPGGPDEGVDGVEIPAEVRECDRRKASAPARLWLVVVDPERNRPNDRVADASKSMSYKGMMYSGIPNLVSSFGYTNASWTLKADLTCEYVCRLLNHMRDTRTTIATPHRDPKVEEEAFLDFSSGYVQRALDVLPRQGKTKPWKLYQNYVLDLVALRYGRVDDGAMVFSNPGTTPAPAARERVAA